MIHYPLVRSPNLCTTGVIATAARRYKVRLSYLNDLTSRVHGHRM